MGGRDGVLVGMRRRGVEYWVKILLLKRLGFYFIFIVFYGFFSNSRFFLIFRFGDYYGCEWGDKVVVE